MDRQESTQAGSVRGAPRERRGRLDLAEREFSSLLPGARALYGGSHHAGYSLDNGRVQEDFLARYIGRRSWDGSPTALRSGLDGLRPIAPKTPNTFEGGRDA
jgi:hypothetical protein